MTARQGSDEATRTATETASESASDPALDATLPSPGNTPLSRPGATGEPLTPGERIGRYEVREVLGAGGMGVVYRAHDPELKRDLAIKVVQPFASGAKAQQRLLEEARAMAKLRHPNIVPVFDVGTTDRGVFIVMPLFAGGTLHDWLRAEQRPWRAVLDKFVAAGRGLAAAHAAGLIHRDFKPKNVFLGDAGEVLVGDFGIAAETVDSLDPHAPPTMSPAVSTVAGTPAYMAPEQATGGQIDARADQYSFCISFWEGLHGERPSEAETRTRGVHFGRGAANVPTGRRGAPAWLLGALTRGFTADRERRWPSVDSLLKHVERRVQRPRRIAIGIGIVALLGAGTAIATYRSTREHDAPCPDPVEQLAPVWSEDVQRRIEASFASTRSPLAADALKRIIPVLSGYAEAWRTAHVASCRATNVARSQSPDLLDRRNVCLDHRLTELRALTAAFAAADTKLVQRAVDLSAALPPLADCADDRALLAAQPMPAAPDARARIAALDSQVDDLRVASVRGAPLEIVARARTLALEARALDYPPVHARALHQQVFAESASGGDPEPVLRELTTVAARAKDDALLAFAWSRLVQEVMQKGRADEARQLESVAHSAIERAGRAPALEFQLELSLGGRAGNTGELEAATAHFRRALAVAAAPDQRMAALRNLAYSLWTRGQGEEARPMIEEALALAEQVYGKHHPSYASVLEYQATMLTNSPDPSDIDRAVDALEAALAIRVAALGENQASVAENLSTLALIETYRNHWSAAETHIRRSVAILEAVGAKLPLPPALNTLGDVVAHQRGIAEARPIYERALAAAESSAGRATVDYVGIETSLATELSLAGDCTGARPYAEHALAVFAAIEPPQAAGPLMTLGRCDIREGRIASGLRHMERALAGCGGDACEATALALATRELGQRLIDTRTDARRGAALLREARRSLIANDRTEDALAIDAWAAAHHTSLQ